MHCKFCHEKLTFVAPGRTIDDEGNLKDYIEQYICEICDYIYILNLNTSEIEISLNEEDPPLEDSYYQFFDPS